MKRIGDGAPLKINVILILYQLHNYLRNRRRLGKHKAGIIYVICVSVVNILLPESKTRLRSKVIHLGSFPFSIFLSVLGLSSHNFLAK